MLDPGPACFALCSVLFLSHTAPHHTCPLTHATTWRGEHASEPGLNRPDRPIVVISDKAARLAGQSDRQQSSRVADSKPSRPSDATRPSGPRGAGPPPYLRPTRSTYTCTQSLIHLSFRRFRASNAKLPMQAMSAYRGTS